MRFLTLTCALLAAPAAAQIVTTDAAVRSPELPSARAVFGFRHHDRVDELEVRGEAVYSPSHDLELDLELPWVSRRLDEGPARGTVEGLGDASLRAKLELLRKDDVMRSDRLALLVRSVLPTGESDETLAGQRVHPRLQPGLGSFGYGVGAAATLVRDRHRASAAIEWLHRLDHDGFEPGDEIGLDVAYWFRLSPAEFTAGDSQAEWRAVVELRGRYAFRDHGPGAARGDRGVQLDAIVGLQVNAGFAMRGELGLVAPLVDEIDSPFGDAGFGVLAAFTLYF